MVRDGECELHTHTLIYLSNLSQSLPHRDTYRCRHFLFSAVHIETAIPPYSETESTCVVLGPGQRIVQLEF